MRELLSKREKEFDSMLANKTLLEEGAKKVYTCCSWSLYIYGLVYRQRSKFTSFVGFGFYRVLRLRLD